MYIKIGWEFKWLFSPYIYLQKQTIFGKNKLKWIFASIYFSIFEPKLVRLFYRLPDKRNSSQIESNVSLSKKYKIDECNQKKIEMKNNLQKNDKQSTGKKLVMKSETIRQFICLKICKNEFASKVNIFMNAVIKIWNLQRR